MHAGKALLIVLAVLLVVVAGLVFFVPAVRPGFVENWFTPPATSAADALDKFKSAINNRNYRVASRYLAGDYKEWFDKGRGDGESLAREVDNLRSALKSNGVKSPKGEFVLFMLDPFPTNFEFSTPTAGESATSILNWAGEIKLHEGQSIKDWQVDNKMWNSMLPRIVTLGSIEVAVKKEKDGWKIYFPMYSGERRVIDTVTFLRNNGSNFKNALQSVKDEVKNNPTTKENFESALRSKLAESK